MPTPQQASPIAVTIAAVLSAIALLLWLVQLSLLDDLTGSDAAGNGLAQGLAAIATIAVWLLLAVIAVIAFVNGAMPMWAAAAALVLIPVSGFAAFGVLELMTAPELAPYRWPLALPALVPPLVIAFCFWALLPAARAFVPAPLAGGFVWGATLLLCVAILPMQQTRQHVRDAREAARARFDAAIKAVPADAPLWALASLLDKGDVMQNDEIIARMRASARRQADAETMLARGDFPLRYLSRVDLNPTPAVCESARAQLRRRAAALTLSSPQSQPFAAIAQDADDAESALRWLIDYDCPAMPEAAAWETMANAYRDPSYTIYELRDLKDPSKLGRALYEDPEHFSMLTPRAHLKAWLKFTDDDSLRAQAIAGARRLDHRTGDAIDILKGDDFTTRLLLENMGRLDLEATPALCAAALRSLQAQFAAISRPKADDPRPYYDLLGQLGRGEQFMALLWLGSHGCDAQQVIGDAVALIEAYQPSPDSGLMLGRLDALRRKP